jgi:hypothetical protein
MVWKQITELWWVNDDGVMLKLYPNTNRGMRRHTEFRLSSVFNTRADVQLTTANSAREKKEVLDFIFKGKGTHFIGAGDWNRVLWNLNQMRKLYFDFEDEKRGSFYDIKYQKCF